VAVEQRGEWRSVLTLGYLLNTGAYNNSTQSPWITLASESSCNNHQHMREIKDQFPNFA